MTHDELLAKIERERKFLQEYIDGEDFTVLHALRAVVELHRCMIWKNLEHDTQGYKCQECEGYTYPCDTIEVIKKELS